MARGKPAEKPTRKTDQATQTVAAILQEFGKHSFDIADRSKDVLEEMCARWIAHILDGAGSPSREDLDQNWLDWPGVRDFVAAERGRERQYVVKNIDEYQELAFSLLHDFSDALHCEQDSDTELRERLSDLRENANVKTGDELKAEVFSAVQQLNSVLEAKKERQDAQLQTLAKQVEALQSELVEAKLTAERDGLTGLYNRASFDKYVEEALQRGNTEGSPYTLILGDIDHFKSCNDVYGHQFGDEVIREVAACMGRVFSGDQDFVARYGGEEFIIITPARLEDTRLLAEQLLSEVRELPFTHEDKPVAVTISLGMAGLNLGDPSNLWIERADRALYASKEMGRNRLTIEGQ
ncbi:MAG: GGDEF domain-containing protein [Planctomycetota bacterium]